MWPVTVRWIVVTLPYATTWASADTHTPAELAAQLAEGLRQVRTSTPPVVMWEMRDAQGRVLTPAEQGAFIDVLSAILEALQAHGL